MNPEEFINRYTTLVQTLRDLKSSVDSNPTLISCLSLEDFHLFEGMIKELLWVYDC